MGASRDGRAAVNAPEVGPSRSRRAGRRPPKRCAASWDAIVLTPDDGGQALQIELRGNLAAMLGATVQTKRSSESDDLFLQVSWLRGPATSGTCSCGAGRREAKAERATRAMVNRIVPLDALQAQNRPATARGDVRRALLHTFPHAVYFRASDETVAVLAVLHLRRNPKGVARTSAIGWMVPPSGRRRLLQLREPPHSQAIHPQPPMSFDGNPSLRVCRTHSTRCVAASKSACVEWSRLDG